MRILIITNQLEMGGAEQFVVRLANELSERRHRITVVSEGGMLTKLLDPSVRPVMAPARAKSPWGLWALARRLRVVIDAQEIEVIHANSPTTAIAARLARGNRAIPIVTSAHGSWREWTKPTVARLFSAGSDRVVGVSAALTRDLVKHGLPSGKAETILNGIPRPAASPPARAQVRAELGLPAEQAIILNVARLSPEKGQRYLIEAMPRLLAAQPDAQLLLAGDGPCRAELEAQVQKLGLTRSVQFLGYRDDVSRLLLAADVFCLPSLLEGLPLSAAEAMAARLPIVATRVGGVPEIIQDGVTGYLVPPRDPAALAERLAALLADPAGRQRFGTAGQAHFAAHLTLAQMASKFEALYERLHTHRLRLSAQPQPY
ncbi:glycosyltransferase [bacterium]|nr:glycosyltransferase [bacterium]